MQIALRSGLIAVLRNLCTTNSDLMVPCRKQRVPFPFSRYAAVASALLAVSAQAQSALSPKDAVVIKRLFQQATQNDSLTCSARTFPPFLDFGFRFEAGYTLRCPLSQFGGNANNLYAFLRITPEDGKSVTLGDGFAVPAIPDSLRANINWQHFHAAGEISGVFAMGEGTYRVELLVVDKQLHAFHKSWKTTAHPRGKERDAAITMSPNHAGSAMLATVDESAVIRPSARGLRVTVLLNASPIYAGATKMRAWDRAFLLQSLSSLLADASYSSVRLVAFNLDQQKEVFRQEDFRRSDLDNLAASLRGLELGKVSYQTLENQSGWSELLARLVKEEAAAKQPADAVIFLGPHSRIEAKVPTEMLKPEGTTPHLFYFEYYPRYGADFPDALQFLTNACKGTVFKMHSPAELAEGIQKMQRILKETSIRPAAD